MPDRIADLQSDLQYLLSAGYQFHTVREFSALVAEKGKLPGRHALVRVDVDSDPDYCRVLGAAFHKLQIPATFYFRLSTLNKPVMHQLDTLAFEVGYHFEEIASFAKSEKLLDKADVLERLTEPQQLFTGNFEFFTDYFGKQTHTVASHGDFANRRLGLANSILVDSDIRSRLGIEAEAYDPLLVDNFDDKIIDTAPPRYWRPKNPVQCCNENASADHTIRMVIHPKQWRRHLYWNTRQNVDRMIEGLRYR